ncbi:UDP-glucose 4-epimerase [Flavobacterium fluvii]|uniref:UDP-glucose 4-epimerase n=1 Tax=Flavobacterium fluvii TaxID=468056 RepID=A0A1M5IPP4_9FLAO|nr:NAD-dependent epimerase/dehydratase family protein [Flavobacterium fluvii]SHG29743.1 UDP-glucose 4-epimerase [Flavobacterium fluvii]
MKNILLLGGTGFIGKNIIEFYINDLEVNLILVTRNKSNIDARLFSSERVTVNIGSISDIDFIKKIVVDCNINVIIHLVSNLIASSSDEEFYEGMDNVIMPTFKLIDFIANKEIKLLFFSSGGTIYGNANSRIDETTALNPINNYGFSKLLIEDYIYFKRSSSQLNCIVIRPSNVYGSFQSFIGNQGFISIAINKIYNNEPIVIWGDGNSIRDYIHVDDVVEVIQKLLSHSISNTILNLSTGVGKSLLEIIEIIEKNLDKKAIVCFNNKRNVDANSVILDNSRLVATIPQEFISVEEGIKKQINYFIKSLENVN